MNRIFTVRKGIQVPDGTTIYPFLSGLDRTSGLPGNFQEGFSLAAGEIAPQSSSKIHVMPLVIQATYVLRGLLEVRMKDPQSTAPYDLRVAPDEVVLTCPGTFLQLINRTRFSLQVLYIVSPPYIYEMGADGRILYNDAVVLEEDWEELEKMNWSPPALSNSPINPQTRQAATARFARKKGQNPPLP
jgi:hypothetical protein